MLVLRTRLFALGAARRAHALRCPPGRRDSPRPPCSCSSFAAASVGLASTLADALFEPWLRHRSRGRPLRRLGGAHFPTAASTSATVFGVLAVRFSTPSAVTR